MIHERLVPGNRLERVVMREGQRRLPRRLGRVGRIEEHRHFLPRAWGRVVEREVLDVLRASSSDSAMRIPMLYVVSVSFRYQT